MNETRRTKIHEAAHAVLAHLGGGRVSRIDREVPVQGEILARNGVAFDLPEGSPEWQESVLAGAVAEVLAGGRASSFAHAVDDIQMLLREGVGADAAGSALERAVQSVLANWATICGIADVLPIGRSTAASEFYTLIGSSFPSCETPIWPVEAKEWFFNAFATEERKYPVGGSGH